MNYMHDVVIATKGSVQIVPSATTGECLFRMSEQVANEVMRSLLAAGIVPPEDLLPRKEYKCVKAADEVHALHKLAEAAVNAGVPVAEAMVALQDGFKRTTENTSDKIRSI